MSDSSLLVLYRRLHAAYGPQAWWPAETPFEVMVGAVLTQNTAWPNVAKAIQALREARMLDPDRIMEVEETELALIIKPSGYFNVKSRRLKALCHWLQSGGGISGHSDKTTPELRTSLLAVHGIGPETADDILLYAFERPVFVIDAYTRRLLLTLMLINGNETYADLQQLFMAALPEDVALYNEYHALIVRHAKERCAATHECRHCRVEAPLESG
jgi:endonuclease-3 related protein